MSKPKVLVIDDQIDVAEIIAFYLEDDFESTICTDPIEAEKLILDKDWDLIVSDLIMPHKTAKDYLNLKEKHGLKIPIAIISGKAENDEDVLDLLNKGAALFIRKPILNAQEFLDKMKSLIKK